MDPSADAEAFLLGLENAGDTAANDAHAQTISELNHVGTEQTNGQLHGASGNGDAAPSANGYTSSGRRNKWGAPMEVKEDPPKPKKRRSRWEEVPEENTDTTLAVVPKEITICGGIRVWPSTVFTSSWWIPLELCGYTCYRWSHIRQPMSLSLQMYLPYTQTVRLICRSICHPL